MKKIINMYKYIIGAIIGIILLSTISVFAIEGVKAVIESSEVTYDNTKSHGTYQDVQGSIDELYRRSGILDKEWTDPILNGADPVLKDPLIPVTIADDGIVHYANLYTKWYEYETKRWANAVILVDSEKGNYKTGDKIPESAIESYFVWIPRYKYKIWDLGNYNKAYNFSDLKDLADTSSIDNNLIARRITGNEKLIDIVFGNTTEITKMDDKQAQLNEYYTHPAFTLGGKELNGIWVGKFEVTGNISNITVKPDEYSLRNQTVGTFWHKLYDYKRDLDSHMMKNTEWGAVAYLSHSVYGIGNEININNNSEYKTGYSATANTDQSSFPGEESTTEEKDKNQPWNTTTGYLASTTGNITGVYDMSGGTYEYMAAYIDRKPGDSGLTSELTDANYTKYFDKYSSNSTARSYNNRMLGDATGEMGPFYNYYDKDKNSRSHNAWYADGSDFANSTYPWFLRGSLYTDGVIAGQFAFNLATGGGYDHIGSRIVLSVN